MRMVVRRLLFLTLAFLVSAGGPAVRAAAPPSNPPTDAQAERTKALVAAGRTLEAGRLEIESRFHLARPMWNYEGLETLDED